MVICEKGPYLAVVADQIAYTQSVRDFVRDLMKRFIPGRWASCVIPDGNDRFTERLDAAFLKVDEATATRRTADEVRRGAAREVRAGLGVRTTGLRAAKFAQHAGHLRRGLRALPRVPRAVRDRHGLEVPQGRPLRPEPRLRPPILRPGEVSKCGNPKVCSDKRRHI